MQRLLLHNPTSVKSVSCPNSEQGAKVTSRGIGKLTAAVENLLSAEGRRFTSIREKYTTQTPVWGRKEENLIGPTLRVPVAIIYNGR